MATALGPLGPTEGTIVAVEGGPGYGSIGSRSLYRSLYAPLLTSRDLLLVDNRGTGLSGAIICRPLQGRHLMELTYVTRCGHELGRTSDLYGTAIAADDMATILTALRIRKVDMYGDSYGSFFVQAFAGRHPERVRSLVLDGAYQVTGGSPWYPSTARTLRRAFDIACARSPVCANLHGSSLDRIERLLTQLRADRKRISPTQVAFVMDSAGLDPLAFRDLDAAARAYVDANDSVPLERLVDETYAKKKAPAARRALTARASSLRRVAPTIRRHTICASNRPSVLPTGGARSLSRPRTIRRSTRHSR